MLNWDVLFFYKWCSFTVAGVSVSHAPGSYTHVVFARNSYNCSGFD